MGLFKDYTFMGKVENYFSAINPFNWLRKGIDKVLGTKTENLALNNLGNIDGENYTDDTITTDNLNIDSLLDYAGKLDNTDTAKGIVNSIPVVGGLASSIIDGASSYSDKQLGILQTYFEMLNNNEQAQINRDFQSSEAKINRDFQAKQAELNRQYQTGERLATQDYNIDMWNMSNEYNSLRAQLQRALQAGVSPHAVIGGNSTGGFTSPVTSSPQSGSVPTGGSMPTGSQSSYSSGLGTALLTSSAVTSNLMSQTNKNNSETGLNNYQLSWNQLTEADRHAEIKSNVELNKASMQRMVAESGLTNIKVKEIEQSMYWAAQLNSEELKIKRQTLVNLYNDNAETIARISEIEQSIKESKQRIKESEQNIAESKSVVEINEQEADLKELLVELKKLEKEFATTIGVPIGTPEHLILFSQFKAGTLEKYIDEALVPVERSKWKPKDYILNSTSVGTYDYAHGFNSRTGTFNPSTYFPNPLSPFGRMFKTLFGK